MPRYLSSVVGPTRLLLRDRGGAVAIIFALALVPLTLAGGIAVDLGRAYIVKNRLAYAIDAAALAVGASSSEDTAELQTLLESFFNANYPSSKIGVTATPSLSIDGETGKITVGASATLDTLLMRIVGIDTMSVAASTEIVRETTGLEVVLVLDNTGSMDGSKLTSLKSSANTLLDILFGDETELDTLFVGVVPFAGTVNIGTGNSSLLTSLDPDDYSPSEWSACVDARADGHDQDDEPPATGGFWDPYLAPDTSSFGSNNWKGFFGSVSGDRGEIRGPNNDCPVALLPLTNVKASVVSKIAEMDARGTTHINLGAVWGWRVLSPTEPFTEGSEYGSDEFNKAIIIMTDGENTSGSSTSSAYGGSVSSGTLDTRLLAVCSAMRDLDIFVYTVLFDVDDEDVEDMMLECTGGDESRFFNSPTEADLQSAFEQIGAQLSNLRISK